MSSLSIRKQVENDVFYVEAFFLFFFRGEEERKLKKKAAIEREATEAFRVATVPPAPEHLLERKNVAAASQRGEEGPLEERLNVFLCLMRGRIYDSDGGPKGSPHSRRRPAMLASAIPNRVSSESHECSHSNGRVAFEVDEIIVSRLDRRSQLTGDSLLNYPHTDLTLSSSSSLRKAQASLALHSLVRRFTDLKRFFIYVLCPSG